MAVTSAAIHQKLIPSLASSLPTDLDLELQFSPVVPAIAPCSARRKASSPARRACRWRAESGDYRGYIVHALVLSPMARGALGHGLLSRNFTRQRRRRLGRCKARRTARQARKQHE